MRRRRQACSNPALELRFAAGTKGKALQEAQHACYPSRPCQVHHPVEYAKVVERIGNEADLTTVDLDDLMPAGGRVLRLLRAAAACGLCGRCC